MQGSTLFFPIAVVSSLAVGGLIDGQMDSNGCQVLAYVPDQMLAFTWNTPTEQAESRGRRTWVLVTIRPADGGGTDVGLDHLGFGGERHWDETFDSFQKAWRFVLDRMKTVIGAEA